MASIDLREAYLLEETDAVVPDHQGDILLDQNGRRSHHWTSETGCEEGFTYGGFDSGHTRSTGQDFCRTPRIGISCQVTAAVVELPGIQPELQRKSADL